VKLGIPCALAGYLSLGHAGVVYEVSTRDLSVVDAEPVLSHGYAQDGKLRLELGEKAHLVSIQTDQTVIDIDTSTRSYHLTDHAELTRIGAQERANREKSVAQRAALPANLPDNLRAMLEQLDAGAEENLALQRQPRDYRATDRHETVDGYVCAIWEYYWKGNEEAEYCLAPPTSIPGGAEWMTALPAEGRYVESAGQWLGDPGRLILAPIRPRAEAPARLGGILLMTRSFEQGKAASDSRVTTVRVEPLKAELFDAPKDYERR
jgi:hypothetical protein